ncbi:MAG: hypothetical protein QF893_23960, partial [Alphaproteobacteria bacterium]|nr:hypothetical protein [Alphaproteobacteria bacterium]
MKRSTDRILTTHVGSLPRPADLAGMIQAKLDGEAVDEAAFQGRVREAVAEAVRLQGECGIDVVTDGEMGKSGFIPYINERLAGFEPATGVRYVSGGSYWGESREVRDFPGFYEWASKLPGGAGDVGTTR